MKPSNSLTILFIVAAALFMAGFACNSGNDSRTTNNAGGSTNESRGTKGPEPPATKSIAGSYSATGTNPNGSAYKADLVITPHEDVYQFTWTSGKVSYDGVGVMSDNEVAVSFTDGSSGKGCGVVLYKIASDGSMEGKAGYWGTNLMEIENAVPQKKGGSDLDGVYDITGKTPDGKDYKGTLTVIKSGPGYTFDWNTGGSLSGLGIRAGNFVAVGFGGKQCSFVGYDVQPDGTLDGKWGGLGVKSLGSEIAKKK